MDEGGDDEARADLNEAKTSLRDARQERFDFLGYTFGPASLSRGTANGIWAQARPRRACNGSRRRSVESAGARQQRSMAGSTFLAGVLLVCVIIWLKCQQALVLLSHKPESQDRILH